MTRLSGTQPLQTPHIDIVITRRSGLLIETRTNLTGLKQFPMVCGVSLTRNYEFSWNVFLLFDVFQLFVLFIILKYCEKISNFNRGDFYIDFICNLHHIHENISLKWQVSKWILHHQLSVKYWEIRPNFLPPVEQWNYLPGWSHTFTTIQHEEILKPGANKVKSHASNHLI